MGKRRPGDAHLVRDFLLRHIDAFDSRANFFQREKAAMGA